jgi:hypothetical protein
VTHTKLCVGVMLGDIKCLRCASVRQMPVAEGLTRRTSAAAECVGLLVRIPLTVWSFVSCVSCVLCRKRSMLRADHSCRGVLQGVRACVRARARACVLSINLNSEEV